jgi:hypothetical protein
MDIPKRDQGMFCEKCSSRLKRLPGGHKMLYFEEGRGRVHIGLSNKPITSYAQRNKMMRLRGATEGGNTVPASVARNPKSLGLKRFMESDKKGKWL